LRQRSSGRAVALAAGLGLTAVALELVIAGAIATADARLLDLTLLVCAFAGLALVFRLPLAAAGVLLVFTDSLFYSSFFGTLRVGPIAARPEELLLVSLLVVALVRPRRRTWGGVAGGALLGFMILVGLSSALAVAAGHVDAHTSFEWGRPIALFALFYVVVRLFPDARSYSRLLAWAVGLAAATGAIAVVATLGSPLTSVLQDPGHQLIRAKEGLGVLERVRLPGLALAYALFWFTLTRSGEARGGHRLLWSAALIGIVCNIALSFNRNMWLGLVVGFILMLLVAGSAVRDRLLAVLAVAATAVVLVVLIGGGVGPRSELTPLVARGETLFAPRALAAESSLQNRARENRLAWSAAKSNLAIGIGTGTSFGAFVNQTVPGTRFGRARQRFLHNQYLYLVLVGGLPALTCFLVFVGATLQRAWFGATRTAAVAACGVGLAMIMLSAFVAIYFSAYDSVIPIAVLAGAIFTLGDAGTGNG
jgi:hypothetical protein